MRMIAVLAAMGGLVVACAPVAPLAPAPGPAGPWRCDAEGAKSLIGSHRGAVTFAQEADVRFVCTTCSATEDYRPDRLNVRFEEATGIIRSVDCG